MSPTILIVEDEADLALMIRYNLEAEGFRVHTAMSGDEAVDLMHDKLPDLILLDWMLPGLSGIELCRRWRSREETSRIPIIMITSRTGEKHRQRAFEIGVDRYLGKPYQENELMRNVQEILKVGRGGAG